MKTIKPRMTSTRRWLLENAREDKLAGMVLRGSVDRRTFDALRETGWVDALARITEAGTAALVASEEKGN